MKNGMGSQENQRFQRAAQRPRRKRATTTPPMGPRLSGGGLTTRCRNTAKRWPSSSVNSQPNSWEYNRTPPLSRRPIARSRDAKGVQVDDRGTIPISPPSPSTEFRGWARCRAWASCETRMRAQSPVTQVRLGGTNRRELRVPNSRPVALGGERVGGWQPRNPFPPQRPGTHGLVVTTDTRLPAALETDAPRWVVAPAAAPGARPCRGWHLRTAGVHNLLPR